MSEHFVRARVKDRWFRKPVIVFDVMKRYEDWYDPSFGHGGGDYRTYEKKLCTYRSAGLAESAVQYLERYKGEKE